MSDKECFEHVNKRWHVIRQDGTRYCRKCGEDLYQCQICFQWITWQGYYKCKRCNTVQCFECVETIENGATVTMFCSKKVSWNRTCGIKFDGTATQCYINEAEQEKYK